MREAGGIENDDLLWAGVALRGGIAGQQRATCGALAASAVYLGLKRIGPTADKKKAEKEREEVARDAGELVRDFIAEFGAASCLDLIGVELSGPEDLKKARESGLFDQKCHKFIPFIVGKLYELEEKRDSNK